MAGGQGGAERASIEALREMRRDRRRRYTEQLDAMEVLYRIYVAVITGAIALGVLAGVINEAPATPVAVEWLRQHGPAAAAGVFVAVGLLAGLRMGAHGGPLAIEAAELQYVLMAPLKRGIALRGTALRQMRTGAVGGAALGAIVGNFVFRRLPGAPVEWIGCLALFGALMPVCFLSAASLASGRRWGTLTAGLLGLLLIAWSSADLALGWTVSPTTMLGELATLPLQGAAGATLAVLGTALAIALTGTGLLGLDGIRLESARRRAALAAELRFSAAVQDLRTVVLLRRQLASERPRRRPWLRLGAKRPTSYPIWRRGCQSFLRWPATRVLRVVLIGIAAGAIAAGAWNSAPLALLVPGALLFIAGLDLIEPLAQESDHPTRRLLAPRQSGMLMIRQLVAPAVAMALVVLIATAAATVAGGGMTALGTGLVLCAPFGLGLACCAAFSATADPYAHVLMPEVGLMPSIGYAVAAAPPAAAVLLVGVPLLSAREAQRLGGSPEAVSIVAAVYIAVSAALAVWLLGRRFVKRDAVTA
jgi:hypothetical protein